MGELTGILTSKGTLRGQFNSGATLAATVVTSKFIGATDYEQLKNLPQIEGVTLVKNKTFDELGMTECTNQDIINLFK